MYKPMGDTMTTSPSLPNSTAHIDWIRFLFVITVLFAGIATTGCDTVDPGLNEIVEMPAPDNRQDFFPLAVGNAWTFADTSSYRVTDFISHECPDLYFTPTTRTEGTLTWTITEALSDSMGYRVATSFTGRRVHNEAVPVIDPVYMVHIGECVEEWVEEPYAYAASFEIETTADSLYVDGLALARLQEAGTDTLAVSVTQGDEYYRKSCLWTMVEDVGVVEKSCYSEDYRANLEDRKLTLLEYLPVSGHN